MKSSLHLTFTALLPILTLGLSALSAFATDDKPQPKVKAPATSQTATTDPKAMKTPAATDIETTPPKTDNDFELRMGIPAWASAISGNVGVRGFVGHMDVPFGTLWNHLDGIAPLSADLRIQKFGFHVDGQWVKLGTNFTPNGPLLQSGTLEMQQAFANVDLSYRVVDTDMFQVDPFIGARYQYLGLHGTIESSRPRIIPNVDASGDTQWADPILGVDVKMKVLKPLSLVFHGDVGGFGVSSRLTAQVYGGTELQVTRCLYMDLGYRYLHTDYVQGGGVYDVDMYGPQLMFGFNF